jgi:hypothetical protein
MGKSRFLDLAGRLLRHSIEEASMTWLYNVLTDLQKRIAGETDASRQDDTTIDRLRERRTNERVRQFQARLHALDRRLAALR